MANTIKLYSISELLEMNFFIPSYQRGYRWTKQQVEDLLNDIYSFAIKKNKKDKEFYCLQPIVVKSHNWLRKRKDGPSIQIQGWEIVDGQQRLTTIRILLSYLIKEHLNGKPLYEAYDKDVFSLDYETRDDTEYFLRNITEDNSENIDFFHISSAYKFIREWFEAKGRQQAVRESIIRTLVCDTKNQETEGTVQVIWYEIQSGSYPIDTFIRINLGKISLTSSELIKALFLQERNFGDDNEIAKLRQLEIANEWDRIENTLQDEDFWWFLNKGENIKSSRIEFIFDTIRSVAIKNDPEISERKGLNDKQVELRLKTNPTVEEKIGTDRFSTFRYFYQRFESNNSFDFIKDEWAVITEYFNTFLEWFNNPIWYHYIGFLIYCDKGIVELFDLTKSGLETKDEITTAFKNIINNRFSKVKWVLDSENKPFIDLSYRKNYDRIRELLLLFNLECIVRQCESNSLIFKFPFKSFKEEHWDVEHVDSFTENPLKDKSTQKEWLRIAQLDFLELSHNENLMKRMDSFSNDDNSKESFESIHSDIIKLAGEETNDENTKNNIGNLTLLDERTNRSYGNALFPTKRRIIIEKDRDGTFIPICTKNVFLKYFDLMGSSKTKWTEADIKNYRSIISDTLIDFLPSKPNQ